MVIQCHHFHMEGTDVYLSSLVLFPEFQVLTSKLLLKDCHGTSKPVSSKWTDDFYPQTCSYFFVTSTTIHCNTNQSPSPFGLIKFYVMGTFAFYPLIFISLIQKFILSHLYFCKRLQVLLFFVEPIFTLESNQNGGHGLNIPFRPSNISYVT